VGQPAPGSPAKIVRSVSTRADGWWNIGLACTCTCRSVSSHISYQSQSRIRSVASVETTNHIDCVIFNAEKSLRRGNGALSDFVCVVTRYVKIYLFLSSRFIL
jgi:hypothetical protein